MHFIWEGLKTAFYLIFTLDAEVFQIVGVSLRVSLTAVAFATAIGVPLGFALAVGEFRGKEAVATTINTLMSLPTVVVGLTVFALISRQGPLGDFGLLFTRWAMVIGQAILATPIVTGLSMAVVGAVDRRVRETALTLGASQPQAALTVLVEARLALMAALVAGFGRVIGEVGSAMMLGGNIRYYTRTITTAIALETAKGEFGQGIALGIILMAVALTVNIAFRRLQAVRR